MDPNTSDDESQIDTMPPPISGSPAAEASDQPADEYGQHMPSQKPIPPSEMILRGKLELLKYFGPFLFIAEITGNKIKELIAKRKNEQIKPLGKKEILVGIAGVVVFCIVAFFVFASVATYTTTSLPISVAQRNGLKVLLYYLPLFPKTPEQILLVAIDKNAQILTATPNFSLSAAISSTTLNIASLDLTVKGPVDFTPDKPFATNVSVDAAASLGSSSYEVSGNMIQKNGSTYFKINKIPGDLLSLLTSQGENAYGTNNISAAEQAQIKKRQQQVFTKWIIYNDNTINSPAKDNLEKNNQSIISDMQKNVQNFFLKTDTLPEVKRVADQTINGIPTYHLLLKPSKKLIKQILLDYVISQSDQKTFTTNPSQDFTNFANSLSNVQIDLWIGKNDAIVRKLAFRSDLDLGFLQSALGSSDTSSTIPTELFGLPNMEQAVDPKLTVSTVLLANDINKPVTITKPSSSVTGDEYVKELTNASKTSAQREVDKKLAVFNKDAYTIRYLLAKYYLQNGTYPASLTDLESLTATADPIIPRLSVYQYKRSADGSEYVVYAQLSNDIPDLTYYTPYYGFTSTDQSVHQLLNYEFDAINNTTDTSNNGADNTFPTPTPYSFNDSNGGAL
jgi:hypothetical protein